MENQWNWDKDRYTLSLRFPELRSGYSSRRNASGGFTSLVSAPLRSRGEPNMTGLTH